MRLAPREHGIDKRHRLEASRGAARDRQKAPAGNLARSSAARLWRVCAAALPLAVRRLELDRFEIGLLWHARRCPTYLYMQMLAKAPQPWPESVPRQLLLAVPARPALSEFTIQCPVLRRVGHRHAFQSESTHP